MSYRTLARRQSNLHNEKGWDTKVIALTHNNALVPMQGVDNALVREL